MFPNLEIEQARYGHTDEYVAEKLGMCPQEYRLRKESGRFVASEADVLLDMYNTPFDYLFERG